MVEKGIRGGICHAIHRHAKANNKYMRNQFKDIESYISCIQIQRWGMPQKFPVNCFKWIKNLSKFDEDFIKKYDVDILEGILGYS